MSREGIVENMHTPEQRAAYVISQSTAGLLRAAGMMAENQLRALNGESPAYGEDAFNALVEELGLDHNSVVEILRGQHL